MKPGSLQTGDTAGLVTALAVCLVSADARPVEFRPFRPSLEETKGVQPLAPAGVPFLDTLFGQCRNIIADEPPLCCGAPVSQHHESYCDRCAAKLHLYWPPRPNPYGRE